MYDSQLSPTINCLGELLPFILLIYSISYTNMGIYFYLLFLPYYSLGFEPIGDAGVTHLASALIHNEALIELRYVFTGPAEHEVHDCNL